MMTIIITEVRNAASLQSDNLRMNVEINHPQHGWIPYTVDPSDTDTTIDNSAVMARIGTGFTPYVAPTQVELDAALAEEVRIERDALLLEVDAISSNPLRWAELDAPTQALWATYRVELLDVPQQTGFPTTVVWPIKPEAL
jgi:hypothetical protein